MNLDEFMHQNRVRNVYVSEPGWSLYVRKTTRMLGGNRIELVLDLANIEATVKDRGTFFDLLVRIRKKYPEWTIFVENVLTPRFSIYLERRGFTCIPGDGYTSSFYLLPGSRLL